MSLKPRGGEGAWGVPRGDPPYSWKKFQCLKSIIRPFGTPPKKNWIWKITLTDPPLPPIMEFSIIFFYFFLTLPYLFYIKYRPHVIYRLFDKLSFNLSIPLSVSANSIFCNFPIIIFCPLLTLIQKENIIFLCLNNA